VIYVYAVTERAPGLAPPRAPLRTVTHECLAAVYEIASAPPEPSPGALWHHEQVAAGLMADRAVLPLRFGSVLVDERALRAFLRERREEFGRALEFVRGRVEVAVRARVDAPRRAAGGGGRDYVAAKLEQRRSRARLAEQLRAEFAPLAHDATMRAGDDEVAASYLVDRSRLDEFMLRARELDARRPDVGLACSGPWPPFSFTGGVHDG
jgi:hypothetical protein